MILKLIALAIVGLLIYRFFGGKFPTLGKTSHAKKLEEDTLVECTKCSTYVTVKESIIVSNKYYCSQVCTV